MMGCQLLLAIVTLHTETLQWFGRQQTQEKEGIFKQC